MLNLEHRGIKQDKEHGCFCVWVLLYPRYLLHVGTLFTWGVSLMGQYSSIGHSCGCPLHRALFSTWTLWIVALLIEVRVLPLSYAVMKTLMVHSTKMMMLEEELVKAMAKVLKTTFLMRHNRVLPLSPVTMEDMKKGWC